MILNEQVFGLSCYRGADDQSYIKYVTALNGKALANWGSPTWFSWDSRLAGTQILRQRHPAEHMRLALNSNVLRRIFLQFGKILILELANVLKFLLGRLYLENDPLK
ncbi:hypothetical protein Sjap_015580 [Stephania japonica]|uniref:Uncharacterized protein n=1 Tax=Stephania japonica TaxID=461633 RepID=A0AAP0NRH8_9MAGN